MEKIGLMNFFFRAGYRAGIAANAPWRAIGPDYRRVAGRQDMGRDWQGVALACNGTGRQGR